MKNHDPYTYFNYRRMCKDYNIPVVMIEDAIYPHKVRVNFSNLVFEDGEMRLRPQVSGRYQLAASTFDIYVCFEDEMDATLMRVAA